MDVDYYYFEPTEFNIKSMYIMGADFYKKLNFLTKK